MSDRFETYTAIELWHLAWPDVLWLSASPEDHKLFLDHANSLYWYNMGRSN